MMMTLELLQKARAAKGAMALADTQTKGRALLAMADALERHQEEILADLLKAETPEQWAKLMLLRHIRRTPPGNDNFSLITVFVEE